MARNTWWVEFTYTYEYWDCENQAWCPEESYDADRFHCLKKDIKKEVEKWINMELRGDKIRNLHINIDDQYMTTEYEV